MTATRPRLADELRDTVEHLSTVAPPHLFAVFGAEQQRLAATDDAAGRIAVGDRLPAATLHDATGEAYDVPGPGAAVLVFYRGVWCPYCNVTLAAYQREVVPELRRLGLPLIAISPQGPDGTLGIAERNDLAFPVLTDPGGQYAQRLGLVFELADDVREAQLAFGNDFETINAGGEWALPKPTVIVVDTDGVVRFVDVRPDYTERTEPAAILDAVRAL